MKAARKLQKDGFLVEEDVQNFINEAQASDVMRSSSRRRR